MLSDLKLSAVRQKLGLNQKDFKLLLEAYRRKNFLHSHSDFLGLGTPIQYRSPYFTASFTEQPRITNWYKLTAEGEEKLKTLEAALPVPQNQHHRNQYNEFLFSY